MGRSTRLFRVVVAAVFIGLPQSPAPLSAQPTGVAVPEMRAFDEAMQRFMEKWSIPGGALAITRNGRLAFARGYGFADVHAKVPVEPDSLFRLASASKPVTAAAILKLIEEKRLTLNTPILEALREAVGSKTATDGVRRVTVRHLLQHSSGWGAAELAIGGTDLTLLLARTGKATPVWRDVVMAALPSMPSFEPGTNYSYSTFGYCTLGLIVEQIGGESFAAYAHRAVLAPVGAGGMKIARALREDAYEREVAYYDYPGAPPEKRTINGTDRWLSQSYAYWTSSTRCQSGGAWVGSVVDYVRFLTALSGQRAPAVLDELNTKLLFDNGLNIPAVGNERSLAFAFRRSGSVPLWFHYGGLPGSLTMVLISGDGVTWAIAFNSRPQDPTAYRDLDQISASGFRQMTGWPSHDLFARYPPR